MSMFDAMYLCQELPLIKPGTAGLTTAVQPSLISYLTGMGDVVTRSGNVDDGNDITFYSTYGGASIWDFASGEWTQDLVAAHQPDFVSSMTRQDPYTIVPSYLYAVTAEVGTGKLVSAAKVPECRRRAATASQSTDCLGMTWPLGIRSLKAYAARDVSDDWQGIRLIWCPRPDNWRFFARGFDYYGAAVNSSNSNVVPNDGAEMGWVNGLPYASVLPDANDTMESGGTHGIWRTLAEFFSPITGPGASSFEDLTLIDPPAAGTEIWISGTQYFGTPGVSTLQPWPVSWQMYPEASVLPWALSKLGGGAIIGGTG
jgi:hypothetical protein